MDQQQAPAPMVAATAGSKKLAEEDARLRWPPPVLPPIQSPPRHRKPSPPVAMGSAATSSPPSVTQEDLERVAVHMGDAAAASPPSSAKAKLKQEELKRVAAHRAVAGEPCGRERHAAARCSSIYLPLPPRAAGHPHGGTRRGSAQGISVDASDEGRHGARARGHVVPAWPPPLPRARLGGGMPEDRAAGVLPLQAQSRPKRPGPSASSRDATTGAPGAALPRRETMAAAAASTADADAGAGLRSEFLQVLRSRRRDLQVLLSVEKGSPVENPMYQKPLWANEGVAMASCPRKEVENFKEKLVEENFYLISELGEQGRVPVLLLKLNDPVPKRKPVIVFLHSSYKCKEWLRPLLEAYASRGYVCVAIDSRYHGERASSETTYIDALKSAWRNGDTMPFIFDTVWDLIKLGDHLSEREDIDPCRIGITGESLGGMHAWFAAFVDTRYRVIVPIIGVQGFQWAIDNNKWQARANSIKPLFEEARIDLGKSKIDTEVVKKVWEKIAPGLNSQFDAPHSLPLIAPRPLLLLNGAEDPRCPIAGLEEPSSRAAKAYEESGSAEKFMFIAEPGIGHRMTVNMVKEASDWFDRFL